MTRKFILFLGFALPLHLAAATFTWNGSASSAWGNAANWTPPGIPGAGDNIVFNNLAPPFNLSLTANQNVQALTFVAGTLQLNTFILNATDSIQILGGTVANGELRTRDFTAIENATFTAYIILNRTSGGGINSWRGNNTFDSLRVINSDDDPIDMSSLSGSTYSGDVTLWSANGPILLSTLGASIFGGDIFLISDFTSGGIYIGNLGGVSVMTSGGIYNDPVNGFSAGILRMYNLIQNVTGGAFYGNTDDFVAQNCVIRGAFIANSATNVMISNCTFTRPSGFIKNGGGPNLWSGGNTFDSLDVWNNDDDLINMNSLAGSTYSDDVTLWSENGAIFISTVGTSTFGGDLILSSDLPTGGIYIGNSGGSSVMTAGGINNDPLRGFDDGFLRIYNLTQNVTGGTFTGNPYDFIAQNCVIRGAFIANSSTDVMINNCTFTRPSGFVKNGGGPNLWSGGNTFDSLEVFNHDDDLINMNTLAGSTYSGDVSLWSANGAILISTLGSSAFGGDIFLSSDLPTGGIYIGNSGGSSVMTAGGIYHDAVRGYDNGFLRMYNLTQNVSGGTFSGNTYDFIAQNCVIRGTFIVNSATDVMVNNCTFSRPSGFVKNGGGPNLWSGGNTFDSLEVFNHDNDLINMNTLAGSTYSGDVTLWSANAAILISTLGSSTFGGDLILRSGPAPAGIYIGNSGGSSAMTSGGIYSHPGGFSGGFLRMYNLTQNVTGGDFFGNPFDFVSQNCVIRGPFIVNSTTDVMVSNCTYSEPSGFIKNGGGPNLWGGGNLFDSLEVLNNDDDPINMNTLSGSTYFGDVTLWSANGPIFISSVGLCTFWGDMFLMSSSPSGGIYMGSSGGNSLFTTGGIFQGGFGGFTAGELEIYNLTQSATAGNLLATPDHFYIDSSTVRGLLDISSPDFRMDVNTFTQNCRFRKTAGANTDLGGRNTFGNVIFNNLSSMRFRMANAAPDNFTGSAQFIQTGVGGSIEPAYSGVNNFAGDISTATSITPVAFGAGSGTVNINGTALQNLNGDVVNPPSFNNLSMNGTGPLALNVPANVTGTLSLTSGLINTTSTNLLTMQAGSSATGGSNASYVNGPLRKIGNTSFDFPVGKGGFIATAGISAPANPAHYFTAEYFHTDPHAVPMNVSSKDASLDTLTRCEYWTIDRNPGPASDVSMTLSWDARSCGITPLADLRVARWDGSVWRDHGNGGTTGTMAAGTILTAGPVTTFSPFTLASVISGPLPEVILSFTGESLPEGNALHWTAENPQNFSAWVLEKSTDGASFASFATIEADHSNRPAHEWNYSDEYPAEVTWYRLNCTDINGNFTPGPVLVLNRAGIQPDEFEIYPNPTSGLSFFRTPESWIGKEYAVTDLTGRIFEKGILTSNHGTFDFSDYAAGLYFLRIMGEEGRGKIVVRE